MQILISKVSVLGRSPMLIFDWNIHWASGGRNAPQFAPMQEVA